MRKPWYRQKTFWGALSGVVAGGSLIASGNVSEGLPLVIISITQFFQRQATNNVGRRW